MAKNYTLSGVAASVEFAKGGGHANFGNVAGVFGFYTDDTLLTLSRVQGAVATAADDFVTLAQLDAIDAVESRSTAFDASVGDANLGAVLPASAVVIKAWVSVTGTALNGDATLGVAGDASIMTAAEIGTSASTTYESGFMYNVDAAGDQLTLSMASATLGTGFVVAQYIVPQP